MSQRAAGLIGEIYQSHGAGCCWHVVIDDGNWDLIEETRATLGQHTRCVTRGACAELAKLDLTASILKRAARKAGV